MSCSTLRDPKILRRSNVGANILGGCIGHGANTIVICSSTNIYTYDADSFTRQGTSWAEGSYYDVCRFNSNQYAATDSKNKCIAIFDENLNRVRSLGSFQYPHGICATSDGQLLVTDKVCKCVYLVDSCSGNIRATIGNGEFQHPEHVAVNSKNVVVVTDYEANFVKGFNMQGCELFCIRTVGDCGGSRLSKPRGITIDKHDNIIVTDFANNRVIIFAECGRFLQYLITPADKVNGPKCVLTDHHGNAVIGRNPELISVDYLK